MPAKVKEVYEDHEIIAQFKELLTQHFNSTHVDKTMSLTDQYTHVKNKFLTLIEIRTLISITSSEYAELTKQIANDFKSSNATNISNIKETEQTPENSPVEKTSDTPEIKNTSGKQKIIIIDDENMPNEQIKTNKKKLPKLIESIDENEPVEQPKPRSKTKIVIRDENTDKVIKNKLVKSIEPTEEDVPVEQPKSRLKTKPVIRAENTNEEDTEENKPIVKKIIKKPVLTKTVENLAPEEIKTKTKKVVSRPKKIVSTDDE